MWLSSIPRLKGSELRPRKHSLCNQVRLFPVCPTLIMAAAAAAATASASASSAAAGVSTPAVLDGAEAWGTTWDGTYHDGPDGWSAATLFARSPSTGYTYDDIIMLPGEPARPYVRAHSNRRVDRIVECNVQLDHFPRGPECSSRGSEMRRTFRREDLTASDGWI